ncbi:MAG: hypothetical protein Q9219_004162 [cf. Caloplaca sp. 3 TL-2023]
MSADRIISHPPTQDSDATIFTPPASSVSAQSRSGSNMMPVLEGTPSRVTINVRDSASRTSRLTSTAQPSQRCEDRDSDKDELGNSSDLESSKKLTPPSPKSVSPSSPSRSPEIEVAEIEDISQEPGFTRWRTISGRSDPAKTNEELWAMFPCRDQVQSVLETMDDISRHLHQQPVEDGTLFRSLADWIRLYLSKTDPCSSEWIELFVKEQEIWVHFINIANALCKRSSTRTPTILPLPIRQNDSKEDHEAFEDLFASFAALTARIVDVECQIFQRLTSDNNAKYDIISFGYLDWLNTVLSGSKSTLWRNLQISYGYSSHPIVSLIVREICQTSFQGLDLLTQFLHQTLHYARIIPNAIDKVRLLFDVLHRIIDHDYVVDQDSIDVERENSLRWEELLTKAYKFFQTGNEILQNFISKQVAALSHDLCDTLIRHLAALLQKFTTANDSLARKVLSEELGLDYTFPTISASVVAEEAWKFQIFRKCFLEGRMEIRIQGVESMQLALVHIHRRFMQGNNIAGQHPVVSFLCDSIVENKVLDYLIGVESHPRLIRLTGNIVGFLVVNHRYTETESDRIWDTVINSQDSGVVGAVLHMLPSIFHILHYCDLLYLVGKLKDVPLSLWDSSMTAYADHLLRETVAKWKDLRQGFGMGEQPYKCCIQLIREASASGSSSIAKRRIISAFGSRMLESLLEVGPSDKDQFQIYRDCIGDIAHGTQCATGSICVINILLRQRRMDIKNLVQQFGLTDLVITEFEQTTKQMAQGLQDPRHFDEAIAARLDLLQHIIMSNPDSISTERGWNLWDAMVGSNAPNDLAREVALVMLVNATMNVRKRNSFIDTCITEYLPKLPPQYFTCNILFFVSHIFHYGNWVEKPEQSAESTYSERLGVDMLWRIALTAPSDTVERKAIETLVTTYVDSPKSQGIPKTTIDRMHIEVVDRCIRQLASAASRLKAFTEGTSSGEDEPMVIVATDEDTNLQRLSFSRSLHILRELFRRIRSHPAYSPVPSVHSQQYNDVEEINGSPITIRYQPFSGASDRSIKSLQLGDLDTVRDLKQRFSTLTGFAQFIAIVGGQKVNLDENNELTLRATGLHERGLFLIKIIHDSESAPKQQSLRGLKSLDLEIMSRFSTFYHFLSLDEILSKDASFLSPSA